MTAKASGVQADESAARDGTERQIAVSVLDCTKVFGHGDSAVRALDGVSVSIRENEFFTLLGPSGCGKTTLLRLIAGFDHPSAGEISLGGLDLLPLPPHARAINTVFQNYALFPHMSVEENIGFGLKMLGKSKADIDHTVTQMLQLVRMEALKSRGVAQISGGQQQRVALARALAPHPRVLLLDEPLSALDLKLRKEMQIELKRLQHETGITFIFVTHDQEEALTMSDRVAVMNEGRILQIGSPREIYDRPTSRFVADFIGDTNFLKAEVAGVDGAKVRLRLPGGGEVVADAGEDLSGTSEATVVVRPEHAQLTASNEAGALKGVIENVVYFGTDTHYHVRLHASGPFIVRSQNSSGELERFAIGDETGIEIREGAARVLLD